MKMEGDLPAPTLQCLLVGKFRSGARLSRRKQWRMGPYHPYAPVPPRRELLAARLGQHRNSPIRQIRAQTVDAAYPRLRREFQRLGVNLPLQGRQGPWEEEEATGSEGARLKSADVGVDRFGLSTGPSAALGSVTPEECLSNGRGRNALFPETFFGRSRKRVPRGNVAKQVKARWEAVERKEPGSP